MNLITKCFPFSTSADLLPAELITTKDSKAQNLSVANINYISTRGKDGDEGH